MRKSKTNVLSNVSERDKILLFILGAILVLAIAYFGVFTTHLKNADTIKEQNKEFSSYVVD